MSISPVAEQYLRLALRFNKYQEGVVDAYYGKALAIKPQIDEEALVPLADLHRNAEEILTALSADTSDRASYLKRQTVALRTMIEKKQGAKISYRDEARLCLGIDDIPKYDEPPFIEAMKELDHLLAGTGTVSDRFVLWRKPFELQGEELSPVIDAMMREAKARTETLFALPENDVEVSLVRDKPWAGYHWYHGEYRSLYELNIDVPLPVWGVLHTTTHEAFCGHHTEAILKEKFLVNDSGYEEFTVNLLGAPCSLISEGLAEAAQNIILTNGLGNESEAVARWITSHEYLHHRTFTENDARILAVLETIGRKPVVNAALMLHEENMPEAEVLAFLKRSSPSEETLHRRTIARLQDTDYPAYMLTYPLGKEKILNELSHSNNKPETFFEIAKQADYKFHD